VQEKQWGLLTSGAIVALVYVVGEEVSFAPMRWDEFFNGTIGFYDGFQVFLRVHHYVVFLFI
jgi:hypothetical protein